MKSKRWTNYFMQLAVDTAKMSKDAYTKVGACIVKDKRILSTGYNGAPSAFPDELVPKERNDDEPLKERKNSYMVHAELNAILNYKGNVENLKNATIYVTVSPCHECAKALSQVGIKKVIYKEIYHRQEIHEFSMFLLDKCGIECIAFKDAFD